MKLLDMTAGGKMMWFGNDLDVTFIDKNPKTLDVIKCDWSDRLPFKDGTFDLAVFDPPHLTSSWAGNGAIAQQYGFLLPSWKSDLTHAFSEMFRVCRSGATIIFKWNTRQFSVYEVLKMTKHKPAFGHTTAFTNKSTTLWCLFVKK